MKSVLYGEGVREVPEYLTLAEQATARLEKIVGRSAPNVSAEWQRTENGSGHNQLMLRIWDAVDEASVRFAPEQLRDSGYVRFSLLGLWDDILRERSHRLVRGLLESVRVAGE